MYCITLLPVVQMEYSKSNPIQDKPQSLKSRQEIFVRMKTTKVVKGNEMAPTVADSDNH